jgi:thioredoxin reductase
MTVDALPVAVIGAGPVGLAAAVHLIGRGETPVVLEAGASVGASLKEWGHVRLFSPWRYVVDGPSAALLERSGWTAPDPEVLPTGGEIAQEYLAPLAALPEIAPHVRLNTRVVSVARQGLDKLKSEGRENAPFMLRVRNADGREEQVLARAVIDASGTYTAPNPLGANGLEAKGEAAARGSIFYGIPDALGAQRARYAGKRVLVAGSGHSAFNTLLDLAQLAGEAPGTAVTWVVRAPVAKASTLFGGGEDDELPARGALGQGVRRLVQKGRVRLVSLRIAEVEQTAAGLVVRGESPDGDQVSLAPVDEIVACTGFRPELGMLRELRLDLDPIVEAPSALAPLIDPNLHSCGTVAPHGATQLRHPEPDFYAVGMKSYGRAPTFLLLTGYEQVRSVVAAIAGDWEAARSVQLVLPETGVCSSSGGCEGDGDEDEEEVALITVGGTRETAVAVLPASEPAVAPARSGRRKSTSVCC